MQYETRNFKEVNLSSEFSVSFLEELANSCNLKIKFGLSFYFKKKEKTTFFSVCGLKSDISKFRTKKWKK